ncbi:MAG: LytTR family DNA-binding domain-containing protein [Bacteroidota bacterium]|nr:LytTR family DNA-binding domain-containing protein [Bacteroidota bacterium]
MKAIIVEDEALIAKGLHQLIKTNAPDIEIVEVLDSIGKAKEYLKTNGQPDLMFLDIQLSDGVSFDLFDEFEISCPVIFTTAYDEYAIRAFEVNSIGYLLKPVDAEELNKTLAKLRKINEVPDMYVQQLQNMLNTVKNPNSESESFKERFMVHEGKSLVPVHISNVACFTKSELIFLITREGKQHLVDYDALDALENLLNPDTFFRANRQYIVHIDSVGVIKPHFSGKLQVQLKTPNPITLEISREKASQFKAWLTA